MTSIHSKTCRSCGVEKTLDGFFRKTRAKQKDGHENTCKSCRMKRKEESAIYGTGKRTHPNNIDEMFSRWGVVS